MENNLVDDALAKVGELGTVGAMKWLAAALDVTGAPVSTTPAAQVQAQPVACPACQGSGEVVGMEGAGPDAWEVSRTCPHCNGTGALEDAYKGVVELLRVASDKYLKVCGEALFGPTVQLVAVPDGLRKVFTELLEIVESRNSQGGGFKANEEGQRRIDAARKLLAAPQSPAPVSAGEPDTQELVQWIRWFLRNVTDSKDFRWVRMGQAADVIESLLAAPVTTKASEDARDAERYRWLIEEFGVNKLPAFLEKNTDVCGDCPDGKVGIDKLIDAERARREAVDGEGA